MKHRYDSRAWSNERRREETADAIGCCALLLLIIVIVMAWCAEHNPREQVAKDYAPTCQTVSETQGFCPH
ncbi:hypothetical protein V5738_11060 [Salinisphaera sp. SPP-AMP-43]|uniref:hypothetical protein n=1 Tax=Salinisphaera sp. SPP-AMP-43 TaxID=3121288 RepID=UPI003C6E52CD